MNITTEQKEGVVITAISLALVAIFLLNTSFYGGHVPATVYLFDGFEVSCSPPLISGCPYDGINLIFGVNFKLSTGLAFLMPILTYGLLRSFGVVKRVFEFERRLFRVLFRNETEDFKSTQPGD